ncbi:mitoferrin-2-like [Brachionus plicatilis]|uniref:Mitoferrin-2-like n=1 Tax=Brachionus plicatilis TaxID=10195 RepID=A0A3M7S1X7_BRAPC|nr:mitoferrin-2-like [Brachionus plicatilis]
MEEDEYESLPPNASSVDHMMAGAAAGIMEHCIIYPVDVVKTRMQCLKPDPNARYNGIVDALVKIVRNEGAFRPVRGMGVVAFGAGPAHALYFSCYEFIKNNFSGSVKAGENSKVNFVAGFFATLLHDAVMVPSDTIKQRLQMYNSPYKGIVDCVVRTTRREGFRAFYKSYFTQLSMNIPFQTTHLVTYDFLQTHLNRKREYNPMSHCVSGAIAGALAAAVTTPLDVCKTLINTQECCNPDELCKTVKSSSANSNFPNKLNFSAVNAAFVRNTSTSTPGVTASGLRDAVFIIYRQNGVQGFFKGMLPRTLFQIPGTAVSWSVYEYFKFYLNKKNRIND